MQPLLNIANNLKINTNCFNSEKIDISQTQTLLNQIANKLEITNFKGAFVSAQWGIFNLIAAATNSHVLLPPLYLVNRRDIPFTGPHDPHLKNQEKVQEFANWLAKECQLNPKKVTRQDLLSLKMALKACEQPENAANGLSFITLHELGHIKNNHIARIETYLEKLKKPLFFIINILTLGIFCLIAKLRQSNNHEKEADEFACLRGSKEIIKGGIYLFDTFHKFRSSNLMERIFHCLFLLFASLTHPIHSKRIRAMRLHL